jgi:hypothetical protein
MKLKLDENFDTRLAPALAAEGSTLIPCSARDCPPVRM